MLKESKSMQRAARLKKLGRLQQAAKFEALASAAGLVAIIETFPFIGELEFVDTHYLRWKQSVIEFRRASKTFFDISDFPEPRPKRKAKKKKSGLVPNWKKAEPPL